MRKEQVLIPLVRQIVNRPRLAYAFGRLDRWGNPYTDEMLADPMHLAEPMRADGPVYRHPLYQQWFVMGYDEAREAFASPDFCSREQLDVLLTVTPYTKLADDTRAFLSNLMLLNDPPLHSRLRGLVNRAFTPRQVSRLESTMVELVDSLLAQFGDTVDLVDDFAARFPAMVITELVGFDRDEWAWLQRISQSLTQFTDPIRSFDPAEIDRSFHELRDRTLELAKKRRIEPTDDLLSALALVEADGDQLSEDELVSMVGLLLIAGHETTSSMIGLATVLLHNHPDQRERLREEPDLWPNAIEEILRMEPTFRTVPRSARNDVTLGDKTIKAGENIVIMVQLANRDLRRMPDADDFRVDREDPSPLTFGHGIHYCLGASLARTELRIALPRLLDLLDDYEVDPSKISWRETLTLRGPMKFPITKKPEHHAL